METIIELKTIPSRSQHFWFELVLVVDGEIIKTYCQERTEEQCDNYKEKISLKII